MAPRISLMEIKKRNVPDSQIGEEKRFCREGCSGQPQVVERCKGMTAG